MTWTYNPSLANTKDKIRFYIGDTDKDAPLLQDEEIAGVLSLEGGIRQAAARCAETIASQLARQAKKIVDDLGASVEYEERAKAFSDLATQLRSSGACLGVPVAGGIRQSAKQTQEENTDRVTPSFTRTLHDDVGADAIFPQVP